MSALPPKADMCGAARDVCFGPIADIGDSVAKLLYTCRVFAASGRQHSYSICSLASGRPPGVRSKRVHIGSTVPTCRGSCLGSVGKKNSSEAQLSLITPSRPLWNTVRIGTCCPFSSSP
jgi:hypothetical protein